MKISFTWKSFLFLLMVGSLFSACGGDGTTEATAEENGSEPQQEEVAGEQPAAELPPIFTSFDGIESLFTKENDSTFLINFWATWCKPCVEELPFIEQLHQDFGDEKLHITLVSLDFPNKLESDLLPFMQKNQLQSDVVVLLDEDYNTWLDKVDPSWGGAIPVTVIYNAEKRIFIERKFESYEELKELVTEYL